MFFTKFFPYDLVQFTSHLQVKIILSSFILHSICSFTKKQSLIFNIPLCTDGRGTRKQQRWLRVTIQETCCPNFSLSYTEKVLECANTEDNIAEIAKEFMMSAEPGLELSPLTTQSCSHQSIQNEETFLWPSVLGQSIGFCIYNFLTMQENSVLYLIIQVLRPDLL